MSFSVCSGQGDSENHCTSRMLDGCDAMLGAEKNILTRSQYSIASTIDSTTCTQEPHCWVDPMGKKHYPPRVHHIKHPITHVEKGRVWESHRDVPETVRDELHREEQQKIHKGQFKEVQSTGG